MSYENAVPKPLKFLISDGKMIDDAGNVIAESETLKDLYIKWAPEVKKYLLSDGSVVDEDNNLIIKNEYYKKMYDQAIPKVQKYLHADGTVDENPGGGGSVTAYAWKLLDSRWPTNTYYAYLSTDIAPIDESEVLNTKALTGNDVEAGNVWINSLPYNSAYSTYTRTSDTEFTISTTYGGATITEIYTRDSKKDLVFWS